MRLTNLKQWLLGPQKLMKQGFFSFKRTNLVLANISESQTLQGLRLQAA